MIHCHMCDAETEFTCQTCEEPVCEKCCEVPTYMNNLEETICQDCYEHRGVEYSRYIEREQSAEDAREKEREAKRAKARAYYHSPAQKQKRKLDKELNTELNKIHQERSVKELSEVLKSFGF